MYQQVIVALDGSSLAEQILPHVRALAEKFDATIVLLRALPPVERLAVAIAPSVAGVPVDPTLLDETREAEEHEAITYLEHVAADLREHGLKVECEHPHGPAAQVILDVAQSRHADLIALTTHGRGGLGRLIFGSVVDEVLRRAVEPMLLVRATEAHV